MNLYDLIHTICLNQLQVGLGAGLGVSYSYKFIRIAQLVKYVQFRKKSYEFVWGHTNLYELATS